MIIVDKKRNKTQNGFTLVELLLYMGLLSILLISLTELFGAILDVKVDSEATSAVEQDSQFIFTRLAHDINRADSISTPANPGNTTSTLVLVINGENYTYAINGSNELELTNNSGTFKLNSSETYVTALSFQKIGPNTKNTIKAQIDIESKTVTNTGPEQKTVITTIGIR